MVTFGPSWLVLRPLLWLLALHQAHGRFYYNNFQDRSHLTFLGDAGRHERCIALTLSPAAPGRFHSRTFSHTQLVGGLFYDQQLEISKGFSTTFSFVMPSAPPISSRDAPSGRDKQSKSEFVSGAAHGFAFVLTTQSELRLGSADSGIGYGGE